mmetsp:Transcript_26882/g.85514  ORF Transcript_26882/g.85514 Transcript_26882/m.85514 type:complete len:220 (-) Transcript_26882:194-853(-)
MRGAVQRRPAALHRRSRVGAVPDQSLDHLGVSVPRGDDERRRAVLFLGLDIALHVDQPVDHLDGGAVLRRDVQHRLTTHVDRARVRLVLVDQPLRTREVRRAGRDEEGGLAAVPLLGLDARARRHQRIDERGGRVLVRSPVQRRPAVGVGCERAGAVVQEPLGRLAALDWVRRDRLQQGRVAVNVGHLQRRPSGDETVNHSGRGSVHGGVGEGGVGAQL